MWLTNLIIEVDLAKCLILEIRCIFVRAALEHPYGTQVKRTDHVIPNFLSYPLNKAVRIMLKNVINAILVYLNTESNYI